VDFKEVKRIAEMLEEIKKVKENSNYQILSANDRFIHVSRELYKDIQKEIQGSFIIRMYTNSSYCEIVKKIGEIEVLAVTTKEIMKAGYFNE
jgi:hypothetical protein